MGITEGVGRMEEGAQPAGGPARGEPEGDERLSVLRMVQQGRLSPEQALQLLEALGFGGPSQGGGGVSGEVAGPGGATTGATGGRAGEGADQGSEAGREAASGRSAAGGRGRVLRIRIFEDGQDRVRLAIPLGLARSALRLIPRSAARYMEGIDLHGLLDQIEQGAYGKILEVLEGDARVEIAVE